MYQKKKPIPFSLFHFYIFSASTTLISISSSSSSSSSGGTSSGGPACPEWCAQARGYHCEDGECVLNGNNGPIQITLQWDIAGPAWGRVALGLPTPAATALQTAVRLLIVSVETRGA